MKRVLTVMLSFFMLFNSMGEGSYRIFAETEGEGGEPEITETITEEETEETEEPAAEITESSEETAAEEPAEVPEEEITEETPEPEVIPEETEEPEEPEEVPAEETEEPEVPAEETEEPEITEPEEEPVQISIVLSETNIELQTGESVTLEAAVSGTEEAVIIWTADDPEVISVDENGTVTALKEGISGVRASLADGTAYADALVTVTGAEDAQITFEVRSIEAEIGETVTVGYELTEGTYEEILWSVSEEGIVTINTENNGTVEVTAVKSGVVQVTAEVNGSASTFAVIVLAEGITKDDEEYSELMADPKAAATVTGTYSVTYNQSSARDLAYQLNSYRYNTAKINTLTYDYTIEKYAMQRAAELALRSDNHMRPDGSEWYTVFDPKYGSLTSTNLHENVLFAGGGYLSNATQVLSSVLADDTHRSRALRSQNKGFGIGHVVYNGIDYWVMLFSNYALDNYQTTAVDWEQNVSVKIADNLYSSPSFSSSKSLLKVNVGKTVSLPTINGKVTVKLGGQQTTISCSGYTVKWKLGKNASKYGITISGGKVKAGDRPNNDEPAYITATVTMNGSTYSVDVQVKVIRPVTGVVISNPPKDNIINLGEKYTLEARVLPDDATDKTVTWTSSNTKIATVSSKGVVTAKKGGTVTITVKTNDGGFTAKCKLTVYVHAEGIAFEFDDLTMTEGMSDTLKPVFTPKDTTNQKVTFVSADPSKVKIEADGTVTALQTTTTPVEITMTSVDNPKLKATLPVTVIEKEQVAKPAATALYEAQFEYKLFDIEETGGEWVNTIIKGDGIQMHTDTKDAVIYYTLDGSNPTTSSTRYTGMFAYPGGDVTLKMIAVKSDQLRNSEITEIRIEEDEEPTWEIDYADLEKVKDPETGVYNIPAGLWVAGVDEKVNYTGGKITFPYMRVYYRNHRLTAGSDYKISYKNNVNVCPEGSSACEYTPKADGSFAPGKNTKVSYVIITGKGNYKGKTYAPFQIIPAEITEEHGFSYQSELYLSLGTKPLKPVPVILWNGKKLKNKTDFVAAYSRNAEGTEIIDSITEAGDYYAIISGVGNYTAGTERLAVPIHVKADAKLLSKASIKIANVEYTGETIDPETLDITVKVGKTVLTKGTDYVIDHMSPADAKDIGTVNITIKAVNDSEYIGEKTGSFKITGRAISKAKLYCLNSSVTYTGGTFELKDLYKADPRRPDLSAVTLYDGDKLLVEGTDYTVTVNGQNKGKGSVKFTGIGEYTGAVTKKFTIAARTLKKDDLFIYITDMTFSKTGAKPEVYVFLKTEENAPDSYLISDGDTNFDGVVDSDPIYGRILYEKTDYTLKYYNNKKLYMDDTYRTKNPPSVSVIMKGNYKGTIANNNFLILSEDISYMRITAADFVYNAKKKGTQYYVKPVIYDYEGKKLTLNKDYTLTYYYAQDAKVNGSATYNRAYGTAIRATDIPDPGTVIGITVTGIGSYYGTLHTDYKVIQKAMNISSSKVTVNYQNGKNKYFEYTGGMIIPTAENLKVVLSKKTLVFGEDYEIISITNNVKAGKATMIIRGIGNYGGTKKVVFNIGKQSLILDLGNLIRSILGGD